MVLGTLLARLLNKAAMLDWITQERGWSREQVYQRVSKVAQQKNHEKAKPKKFHDWLTLREKKILQELYRIPKSNIYYSPSLGCCSGGWHEFIYVEWSSYVYGRLSSDHQTKQLEHMSKFSSNSFIRLLWWNILRFTHCYTIFYNVNALNFDGIILSRKKTMISWATIRFSRSH